jgi:flagellar biogenesis protein FliO
VSTAIVGPKARLVVAEVAGRLVLLGVTDESVRRLAWLKAPHKSRHDQAVGESLAADSTSPARTDPLDTKCTIQTLSAANTPALHSGARGSKFSQVLSDAIGLKPRESEDPVVAIAKNTRDRLTLSSNAHHPRAAVSLIDIEGQAAGLLSRLAGHK